MVCVFQMMPAVLGTKLKLRAEEGVSRLCTRKSQSCTSKGNDSNCIGHRNVTSAYLENGYTFYVA